MKIKFCGMTNEKDAQDAISLGADALGFIFYEKSPRFVKAEIVEKILPFIPPFVQVVGVFVNQDKAYIEEVSERCRLDIIQLHGDESPHHCLSYKKRVIKAIRVACDEDIKKIQSYQGMVSAILLDSKQDNSYGGTGQTFDWGLALQAKEFNIPIVLSGGIRPENIKKAVTLVNPFALDICSGVEEEPGIKAYQKMQDALVIAAKV